MDIVLDEWITSFIANPQAVPQVRDFLDAVMRKCDKFVTTEASPLERKIWEMSKQCDSWPEVSRRLAREFIADFRKNALKWRTLPLSDMPPLPSEVSASVKDDDQYLARGALATEAKLIVTIDRPLKDALNGKHGLVVRLVDEFVEEYDP